MADSNRNSIPVKGWQAGVNSLLPPTDLPATQLAWAENVIIRGGTPQTRPGYNLAASIPGIKVQGAAVFTPTNTTARLLVAVDGEIYVGQWPQFNFVKIEGLKFNPAAKLINFCECLQSVKRRPDSSLEIISPQKVVIIADGENPTCMWDGVTVTKLNPANPDYQTPVGLWMVWTSSRLWISVGTQVRVSDRGNPSSFFEDQTTATRSFFNLPDIITGMVETANERGLLVFSERTTTAFQSHISDRNAWGTTTDFQKLVFPNIGCVAGRTAINQYGLTYWFSLSGLVSLDAALNTVHSSKLLTVDGQMSRSKRNLSPDMEGACAAAFENLLLVSVPSGGRYNEQTWVLDQAPMENLLDAATAWAGVWTGTRPVQWLQGSIGGRTRLFYVSYDRTPANDTHIHLWEAIREDRKDGGGRISCQVEQGIISGDRLKTFKYAEFEVVEMLGDVSLQVFVKGTRGPWVLVGQYELRAEEGSIGSFGQVVLDTSSILQAYKPQSRTLRTNEFNSQGKPASPENSGNRPGRDKGFGLLFQWQGRMGVHDIRIILDNATESDRGKCSIDESGQLNIVIETGDALKLT